MLRARFYSLPLVGLAAVLFCLAACGPVIRLPDPVPPIRPPDPARAIGDAIPATASGATAEDRAKALAAALADARNRLADAQAAVDALATRVTEAKAEAKAEREAAALEATLDRLWWAAWLAGALAGVAWGLSWAPWPAAGALRWVAGGLAGLGLACSASAALAPAAAWVSHGLGAVLAGLAVLVPVAGLAVAYLVPRLRAAVAQAAGHADRVEGVVKDAIERGSPATADALERLLISAKLASATDQARAGVHGAITRIRAVAATRTNG